MRTSGRKTVSGGSELRDAAARIRAEERETRAVRLAFDVGQEAHGRGEALDACRYRNPARLNSWRLGWQDAERQRVEFEARQRLTDEERARGLAEVAAVRLALCGKSIRQRGVSERSKNVSEH